MNKNNLRFSKKFMYLIAGGSLATFILSKCDVSVQVHKPDNINIYMVNEKDSQEEIKNRKLKNRANEDTTSFHFQNYHITEDIINLNDISPNTSEITFTNCQIDNLDFIASLENLKIISFIGCKIDDKQFKNLSNSIENITITKCSTEQFKNLCRMTNLNFLTIGIDDEFDYTLFSKLSSELEGLIIADSSDTNNYFDFSNISNLKSIKTLQLKTNKKVKNVDSIKNMISLNTLIISEYNYENLEFIKNIPNLEKLYLTVYGHDLENGLVDLYPIVELNNERQDDNKLSFHGYVVTGKNSFINYSLEELQELINNKGKQLKKSKK